MKTKIKTHIKHYQYMYAFIITLLIGGFFIGIYLFNGLSDESITSLSKTFNTIFNMSYVKEQDFFYSNLFSNIIQVLMIFIFGLSVVGIPVIGFVVFTKGVQIGFSCALYIKLYSMKGILGIGLTLIPQIIIELITIMMLSAIAIEISMHIGYTSFINKQVLNIKNLINHYLNYFIISLIFILISTLSKIYLIPYLLKLFMLL